MEGLVVSIDLRRDIAFCFFEVMPRSMGVSSRLAALLRCGGSYHVCLAYFRSHFGKQGVGQLLLLEL